MVVGDRNRTCRAEARWSGRQPECREINCGPPGPLHANIFITIGNIFNMSPSLLWQVTGFCPTAGSTGPRRRFTPWWCSSATTAWSSRARPRGWSQSSSCQHFIIHLSLQIARFLQATFVQPLLLEGSKSVNLSCKTAVKKTKGKYENGWITKARSTTNFWLSENYFPQNLWSWCEAQPDLCVWWFNVDIFQFQKLQWPWIRRPPGKWWIFAAKRLSVRVAAGGIKVSDTGISVHSMQFSALPVFALFVPKS